MAKNTALGAEKSKKRTPPKPYSEDTLLSAMETAGNQEFDEETEKKCLERRQPGRPLLKSWYLPVMP